MANKKFLPIKIFEKRKDYDERSTEGGGDSKEPSWVLHGETLSAHSAHLRKEISEIKGRLEIHEQKQSVFPMLITTTMHGDALAKSHRGRVTNVLEADGNDNVRRRTSDAC